MQRNTLGSNLRWLGIGLGVIAAGIAISALAKEQKERARRLLAPVRDYSDRSGFPKAPDEMRGAARDAARYSITSTSASPSRESSVTATLTS